VKRKLSANILKITVILILAVSLIVGVALPGVAAPDEVAPQVSKVLPDVLRGKVTSVGEDMFVIESGEQEEVTIAVDDNTKYFKVSPRRLFASAQNKMAPKRIEAQERASEEPVSLKSRLMARVPWLKKMRSSQVPPPGQAPKWIGAPEVESEEPVSLKARLLNIVPWLKRMMISQAPPRGQSPKQIQAQERVSEGPVSIKLRPIARVPWPKRAGIAETSPRMQEESQELTANLLTRGEGKGIPKPGLARLDWLCRFGEEAGFEDIAVGDKVAVRLSPGEDTSVAKLVIIIKALAIKRISGTIDAVSDDSITITDTDGSPVILSYNENTIFILKGVTAVKPGQSVHAVYNSEDMMVKLVRVCLEPAD